MHRVKQPKKYKSRMICSICNFKRDIVRKIGKKKKAGHRKPMFCPKCDKKQLFIEMGF